MAKPTESIVSYQWRTLKRRKTCTVIIFVQPLGHLEEYDLRDVLRVFDAAEHPERGVVDGPLVADHDLGKCLAITVAVAAHQHPIGVVVHNYTRRRKKLVGGA